MVDNALSEKISQIVHRLPPMPEDIDRLFGLMSNIGRNEQELRDIIQKDAGLCTELLQLANSDCYESAAPAETVDDAIKRTGLEELLQLVCVSYADKAIEREFAPIKHLDQYFEHSREISLGCRILVEVTGRSTHERQMYAVAGLIHDIGRLVLMLATNKTTASFMGTSPDELLAVIPNECELVGINHCEIGEQICRNWHFSTMLREGVLRHHTPMSSGNFSAPGAVIFLAHFITTSDFTGKILSRMAPIAEIMDKLRLSESGFEMAAKRYSAMK